MVIDPISRAVIPPLTPEEYAQLEANLRAAGSVRDPSVAAGDALADGQCRYGIGHRQHLPCTAVHLGGAVRCGVGGDLGSLPPVVVSESAALRARGLRAEVWGVGGP